ncbi:hypothetical protein [Microbacterium oleivorans]|uniref:Uncharacterized protein n=1 Tax=Microbacterium oleivorans TaxID=273677 RepID=A0A177K9Q5_9MICO|nr:hypothetical protein [Microbacterium oleivorans]OAH50148.1 hypothetical protein AYL44_06685 [Microbacterium oleivorans]
MRPYDDILRSIDRLVDEERQRMIAKYSQHSTLGPDAEGDGFIADILVGYRAGLHRALMPLLSEPGLQRAIEGYERGSDPDKADRMRRALEAAVEIPE